MKNKSGSTDSDSILADNSKAQMAIGKRVEISEDMNKVDLNIEIMRSKPDYVVYAPQKADGANFDAGNEHFLVFDGSDNRLMAIWTQSSYEGAGDHRIMFSISSDEGHSWSVPGFLVGSHRPGDSSLQASWGFPMVSESGRIYIIYNQFQGIVDYHPQITGSMDVIYSDDAGKTWSGPATIPMQRSLKYDHPDHKYPANWIVWQKPIRDLNNKYLVGFTRWVSPEVATKHQDNAESVIEFMRFNNIDDNPLPENIKISYFASEEEALRVPHWSKPELSIAEEPSIVILPDKRYFCTMRTKTGYIWYSVSPDGENWCAPKPLLRKDKGLPIKAPQCCTPIYLLSNNKFLLIHQDNNGGIGTDGINLNEPSFMIKYRRPASIAIGEFRKDAEQPIWFSDSKVLMDNDGIKLGPLQRLDIGVYPSMTFTGGNDVLWHPERKFFLLGKKITDEIISGMLVPEQ